MPANMQEPRFGAGDGLRGLTIQPYITVDFVLNGTAPATAGNWGGAFRVFDAAYELVQVKERHGTAGTNGGAVTVMLTKAASGTALSAGTNMLSAGLDMKATADTNQSGSLSATAANTRVASGDAIGFVLTGTPAVLATVAITTTWKRY